LARDKWGRTYKQQTQKM